MSELRKSKIKKRANIPLLLAMALLFGYLGHTSGDHPKFGRLNKDTIPVRRQTQPARPSTSDSIRLISDSLLNPVRLRRDTLRGPDSLTTITDTFNTPTVDTFNFPISKDTLDAPINYKAADSAVILIREKLFILYGGTETKYKDITLTAPTVEMNQATGIVSAFNKKDSLGIVETRARFSQGQESFQSDTIRFNFKQKRGITTNTYAKQNDMWVQSQITKIASPTTSFARNVTMTTCNYDEPHFGFVAGKAKFVNNKVAITGPVHPEFEGVPIPIWLPFGFFPLNPGRHSGLLPPRFEVNAQWGIGLSGLGYYHVFNDYWDATLLADLWSYGGFRVSATPNYRKRYKYSGGVSLSFQRTKEAFKGDPDFSETYTFNLGWNHTVDAKSKPGRNFSARLDLGSTKFNRAILNDPTRNVMNTQQSSINYSRTWAGKPYNISISANQTQNNQQGIYVLDLPTVSFGVTTLYPFQRKEIVGATRWYEKIGVGYNGETRTQTSFYDTTQNALAHILDTMEWGARHSFPITMSLPPLGNIIVSPGINYEETWFMRRIRRGYNPVTDKIDTLSQDRGFYTDRRLSTSIGINTQIFGTFNFGKGAIRAIRHTIRPSFSMSYTPNLNRSNFDEIIDTAGNIRRFYQFDNNRIYTGYGSYGDFGGISFGVDNVLEMKVRNRKDTTGAGVKKISVIDGFGFQSGYNFLADSFQLLPFSLQLRSRILEKINLTVSGSLEPYDFDLNTGRRLRSLAIKNGYLGTLNFLSVSMSTQFKSKPRDPNLPALSSSQLRTQISNDPALAADRQRLMDYMQRNPAEFVDFNLPWSLDLSLSFNMTNSYDFTQKRFVKNAAAYMNFNNSFSLTPKWNFSTNGYYDFQSGQLTQFTMSISRDLHCWQMAITVSPIGLYNRYFSISISPKSPILQDLRINRTRSFTEY